MKQVKPLDQLTADELADHIEGTANAVMEISIEVAALTAELERRGYMMEEAKEACQPNSTLH